MTVREFYRNVLIELNKEEASALYVEDFLYYANKAINWYANTRYNQYDTTQQLGDDLKDLRKGPETVALNDSQEAELKSLNHPYRHLLNCVVTIKKNAGAFEVGCEQKDGTVKKYAAKRMTADRKTAILNNTFLEPKFYRPYYDIRGGVLEVITGDKSEDFSIDKVEVEYLKNPEKISMEAKDLLTVDDTTDEIEFEDYVITEILNQTLVFILEQAGDPRVSVNPAVNQSIQAFGGQ